MPRSPVPSQIRNNGVCAGYGGLYRGSLFIAEGSLFIADV